jgi:hypothetical protein
MILLGAQNARYVRIEQTGNAGHWWSINELHLYNINLSEPTLNDAPNLNAAPGWGRIEIQQAYDKGFVPGGLLSRYEDVITRAEFCFLTVRWIEYELGKSIDAILSEKGLTRVHNAFPDTDDPFIVAMHALGIAEGDDQGRFNPNGRFTRQDASVLAFRTLGALGIDRSISGIPPNSFTDAHMIAGYARDAVNFCVRHNVARGYDDGSFKPLDTFRRVEAIAMLNRLDLSALPRA